LIKIGIIGIGFVGLSFAAALGSKGYEVLAIDSDQDKVKKINKGSTLFYEPGLSALLQKALKRSLEVSSDTEKAVNECDLIFITVGTPTTSKGSINLNSLKAVAKNNWPNSFQLKKQANHRHKEYCNAGNQSHH